MGRNHRHKKDLKAEKAKVKLKQSHKTKFLPKGLNVTNTSFKIKPIVLPEQLKEKEDIALSKRKLNIKDLLSRIKHYNDNVRSSACEELATMMKIHSQTIHQHLSQVILSISTLMQDRESKVRRAAVKVVNSLLEVTSEEKLDPFSTHFSTNMRCAMTNINRTIQEDSLLFLDCFLKHNSGLISKTADRLLPDFFTLISKLRNDSQVGRTLSVNLGSQMTSVTWRIKVLSRLHAVLRLVLNDSVGGVEKEALKSNNTYKVEDDSCNFPMYKESFCRILDSSIMLNTRNQTDCANEFLNRHIITLVPLLYETWIEVVPQKNIGKPVTENTSLTQEASAILSCVMNTLYLLWKYVQKNESASITIANVFLSNEGNKFLNHLLTNFPYCQAEGKFGQKKQSDSFQLLEINDDPRCVKENILICYMYCVLKIHNSYSKIKIEMAAITAYITKCLLTKKYITHNNIQYLLEFLKSCLVNDPKAWKRAGANLSTILENTILFYNCDNINENHKLDIFNILIDVVDNPNLNRLQDYSIWIASLPNILCQSQVSDILVNALLKLSKRRNTVFHKALVNKLPNILENLESLKVLILDPSLINNEEKVKRNIVNIYFFVPVLSKENIIEISEFIMNNPQSKYCPYFIDMCNLRLDLKNCDGFEENLMKSPMGKLF